MYKYLVKSTIDKFASLIAIIVLSPLILLIIVLIKITDKGPVLYTQKRVGIHGKAFKLFKFRTMPINTKELPSAQIGSVDFSWIGKFLRRTNLDELPQLLNILFGQMSIVGPRPSMQSQKGLINLRKQKGVLKCMPGLTGLAQVNSFNGMQDQDKVYFDAKYANNITLINDLKIVLKTFSYLLKPPPIY